MLSSCIVKPYKSPVGDDIKLQELYEEVTDTTKNIAQTPWREIFTDENLVSLIDTVLVGNFDSRVAMLRVEQSYAMLRSSRAQIAPNLSAAINYNGSTILNTDNGSWGNALTPSLGLNWEVDIWGKLYANKKASEANFWATQEAVSAARQSLIAATASAYYSLVALDAKKRVIKEAIKNRTEYLETTKTLKESGKVNEVAVQQAQAQLSEVMAALPNIRMAIASAENSIALLAGKTHIQINRIPLRKVNLKDIAIETGTPVQLLSFRPDVRSAEMNYRAKHYLFMASRAALYPSLTLGASVSVADVFSAHNILLNAIGGLTAPIFNGRKLRSQKESAEAEAKIAQIQFEQALFKAVVEVEDAVVAVRSYNAMVKHQKVQLQALRNAYDYSGELFLSGYATYLDVLIAQTSVYNGEQTIIDSYLAAANSRIELYRALGGGADVVGTIPTKALKHDSALENNNKN